MELENRSNDRREKRRFAMQRELRYKVTGDHVKTETGAGRTIDLSSNGVAFFAERQLPLGAFVELSIEWPVLLGESCPMRLNAFGRILRSNAVCAVCSIDKYEFRTAPRVFQSTAGGRSDEMLERWAEGVRKGMLKVSVAGAGV